MVLEYAPEPDGPGHGMPAADPLPLVSWIGPLAA
jgi:hypothetical protein